jgi:hypothetical protein
MVQIFPIICGELFTVSPRGEKSVSILFVHFRGRGGMKTPFHFPVNQRHHVKGTMA